MPIIDVRGVPTHHEVAGSGEPLLLLHGGFCSLETMRVLADLLATSYAVHAVERPGHGRTADRPGPFSYDDGVLDTLAYLDAVGLDRAHVVGFSDGAIIGLLMALEHPTRLRSLVAVSGNLDPDCFVPDGEAGPDGRENADRERRDYLALSPDGPEHVDVVLAKLGTMWTSEPHISPGRLATITAPTLVMAGDRDVIALDHTRTIARGIPDARLAILPGSHLLVGERPALVAAVTLDFLDGVG